MDAAILSPAPLHATIGAAVQLIFPSLAFGLAAYLAVVEGLYVGTRNEAFRTLYGIWSGIFGVCFVLGMVAILALGRALGWEWSGAQLTLVILSMSGLVAAMLFGRDRVGAPTHVLATGATAVSMTALLVWVVSLDAAQVADTQLVYERSAQLALGAFLATALGVGAISAWRLLREPEELASALALRMSVGMLAISATLRLMIGELAWRSPLSALVAGPRAATLQFEAVLGGMLVLLALWAGWLERRRGGPERSRPFLRSCLAMGAVGLMAVVAGWAFGRADQAATSQLAEASWPTLALWFGYAALFTAGGFMILRLAARPTPEPKDAPDGSGPA